MNPALLVAASVGTQLYSGYEQQRAANAQAKAQNDAITNQQNLLRASTEQQLQQAATETGSQMGTIAQQALAEKGRLSALTAETGLSGNTANALFNEIEFAKNSAMGNIYERNQRGQVNAANSEMAQQAQLNMQKAANSQAARAQKMTLAKLAAIGTNAYTSYMSMTNPAGGLAKQTGMSTAQLDRYRAAAIK